MEVGFQDLDVMAIGPVVSEVSNEFDLFWNSASAYPAASLIAPAKADSVQTLREAWDEVHQKPEALRYIEAVRQTPLLRQLADGKVNFEWTMAHVVHDDPAKVLESTDRSDLQMLPVLEQVFGNPKREIDLVSPYFVPGPNGAKGLAAMARSSVKVRILTNSLSATDVSPVHAGYSKYRKELLQSGVVLYELKPGSAVPPPNKDDDDRRRGLPGSGSGGSSASSLHAKTFAVDRERIFVGSFNIDPRSAHLNTEMGVIIESPELAGTLARQFEAAIPARAYLVRLQPNGHDIEWVDNGPGGETVYTTEPGAGATKRLWIDFLEILPIEWLL
jgi:putative cardiolipin synthase